MSTLTENQIFDKANFSATPLPNGIYEECTFKGCNFAQANLAGIIFRSCRFSECDFSLAIFKDTALQEVQFSHCKLLGVQLSECGPLLLQMGFEHCMLRLAVFYKLKLKSTHFIHCDLQEADFTETDLTASIFDHCDLSMATFDGTNLEKADLRSAVNYSINPANNRIRKARFSLPAVTGLLDYLGIEIS